MYVVVVVVATAVPAGLPVGVLIDDLGTPTGGPVFAAGLPVGEAIDEPGVSDEKGGALGTAVAMRPISGSSPAQVAWASVAWTSGGSATSANRKFR